MASTTDLLVVDLPFACVPAPRPRVSRWGTYYPATYVAWKAKTEAFLKAQPSRLAETGRVGVEIVIHLLRPKSRKQAFPRGDIDNLAKSILDAITKTQTVWHDDDQVAVLTAVKKYGSEARTSVRVYLIEDNDGGEL